MAVRVGKDLFVINRCADIDIGFRFCDEGLIDVRKLGEFIYKVEFISFGFRKISLKLNNII